MNLRPDLSGLRSKLPGGSGAKAPTVKAPQFLQDVYYDLRERRLLPLVALIVVAIAAVPFLLGGDDGPPLPPAPEAGLGVDEGSRAATLAVVESTPGLRDYHKRLQGTPTDPFEQQYTSVPETSKLKSTGEGESSQGTGGGSTIGGGESGGGESESGGSTEGSGDGGKGGGTSPGRHGELRLIEFRYTIQVSHSEETADGKQKMSEPQVRRRVPSLTQLPGEKLPLVTVAGVNLENGRVYFLVSRDVKSLDGDFVCKARTPEGLCELLEIDAGFPLEVTYGDAGMRYRFKVTDIDAVWGKKLSRSESSSRAAFGGATAKALPQP